MNTEILLRQYEYSIFPSALILATIGTNHVHNFSENRPLADVKLDFEKQSFFLECDWNFIIASNKHAEQSWFDCHNERIRVNASICPCQVIDLTDEKNDGLVFALDGTLTDEDSISVCSGLLVLDNVKRTNGAMTDEWSFTFYIYDAGNDDCEIRLKLPLYAVAAGGKFN